MTRFMYGGGITDVYLVEDAEGDLRPGGGYPARFYSGREESAGQYTNLESITNQPITFTVTSTGNDGWAAGQITPFLGPDNVVDGMWCSVNGSPRFHMQAANFGSWAMDYIQQMIQHLTSGVNPHLTTFLSLPDVDTDAITAAAQGSTIVKGPNGLLIAGAAVTGGGGGTGDVTLAGEQTFTGAKTFAALTTFNRGSVTRPAATNAVAAIVQALANQSGNLNEWRDAAGAVRAWFGSDFGLYAPNTGRSIPFAKQGPVGVGAGGFSWVNDLGIALPIRSVRGNLGTAGTTATTFDVQIDGTSIYTVSGNRPSVAAGAKTSGRNTGFSTLKVPAGAALTASVLAAGTGAADSLLQVELW